MLQLLQPSTLVTIILPAWPHEVPAGTGMLCCIWDLYTTGEQAH